MSEWHSRAAQVLTAGQELAFDYQGDLFILRPVSMMIAASQDKSAAQGLLTDTTAITFEPAPGLYGGLDGCPDPACCRYFIFRVNASYVAIIVSFSRLCSSVG